MERKPFYERFIGKSGYIYAGFLLLCSLISVYFSYLYAFYPIDLEPELSWGEYVLSHSGQNLPKYSIWNVGQGLRFIYAKTLLENTAAQCETPIIKATANLFAARANVYMLQNSGRPDWDNLRSSDGDGYVADSLLKSENEIINNMLEMTNYIKMYESSDGNISTDEMPKSFIFLGHKITREDIRKISVMSDQDVKYAREMIRR